ncbi:hypothetical protein JCM24511_01183 [Saitozyma sp. JCM 24511]|nr:hypothetical protein JCM24511_01183 [Saitozyma sp. JCM 24511]
MTVPVSSTNGDAPVDILLIGLGSIGSVYAYILEKTGKARVTAVARSNYDLYTKGGVTLATERFGTHPGWKPYRIVKSQSEAFADDTHYAFCLVTTKCLPDVNPTPKLLADAIASGKVSAWALIQNGLGIEEDLYQAVKHLSTPIISSLAWIGIMTNPDGSVVNWRGQDTLASGIYPPLPSVPVGQDAAVGAGSDRVFSKREKQALELWVGILRDGGANVKVTDHVDATRFSKNIWNCAWSSIQGLVRTRPASWYDIDPSITQPMRDFMREIVDVGFEAGLLKEGMIQYPGEDLMGSRESVAEACWTRIIEMSHARRNAGGGHKMSLWVDVEMGRPIEVEVIVGAVVRLAKQIGVQTPLLNYTYALMKGLQVEILEQQEAKREAAKKTVTA